MGVGRVHNIKESTPGNQLFYWWYKLHYIVAICLYLQIPGIVALFWTTGL